jgi:hypothetical protein
MEKMMVKKEMMLPKVVKVPQKRKRRKTVSDNSC